MSDNRKAAARCESVRISHGAGAMEEAIRVARVDELPPGKGKVVLLGRDEVAVYNIEGRLRAVAMGLGSGRREATSRPRAGRLFDALAEDSPARLADASRSYPVAVIGEYVVVQVTAAR